MHRPTTSLHPAQYAKAEYPQSFWNRIAHKTRPWFDPHVNWGQDPMNRNDFAVLLNLALLPFVQLVQQGGKGCNPKYDDEVTADLAFQQLEPCSDQERELQLALLDGDRI